VNARAQVQYHSSMYLYINILVVCLHMHALRKWDIRGAGLVVTHDHCTTPDSRRCGGGKISEAYVCSDERLLCTTLC